jgi:hypothetical protein
VGDNDDDSPAISGSRKDADRAIEDAESTTATFMKGIFDQGSTLLNHFESSEKLLPTKEQHSIL